MLLSISIILAAASVSASVFAWHKTGSEVRQIKSQMVASGQVHKIVLKEYYDEINRLCFTENNAKQ
jgi:hypothetical protein